MKNKCIKIFILLTCFLALFFYYIYVKKSEKDIIVENVKQEVVATTSPQNIKKENNLIIDAPNKSEINENSEIEAYFQGYYFPYTKAWEIYGESKCEGFVVRTGDENGLKLKQYFIDMINAGNSINKLSAEGDLIINLNPNDIQKLDEIDQEILKSSNEVILSVKKLKQTGISASPCHSVVEFYQVDDYQYD